MPPVPQPTVPPPTPAPQTPTNPGVLRKVGNNGSPSSMFPLARCHGDCDPGDCQTGLVCFERGDSNPVDTVPGCTGDAGRYGTDYCISLDDIPANTLISIGDNGKPPGAFKLGNCQGTYRKYQNLLVLTRLFVLCCFLSLLTCLLLLLF